ncbi:type I secretion system permease/ATPase [Vineibacter terrae]|uniref:Type I secretion system permease/ATPase n=2 Tax=Vineibacter terrae TaxID=2586908 RepID=A0A5C8PK68_9HYPH|nr:type I secretion system permease/ATPase [Vineibacter terrae]
MHIAKPLPAAAASLIWRQAPALVVFSFLVNLLLLVSAIYMLQVYDRVLSSGSLDTLVWLTAAALAAMVVYGLLEHVRRLMLGRIGYWLETELSGPVIRRTMQARLAGTKTDASLRDVGDLRAFMAGEPILAFLDAPWAPVFIGLLWFLHPALGVLATAGAAVLFLAALTNDLLTRKRQQRSAAILRASQTSVAHYVENAETISALGMTGAVIGRWQERQREAGAEQQRLAETTAAIGNVSRALRLALQTMILGLGAYYVLQGQLTSGGMVAGSIILGRALAPVERSIAAWRGLVAAAAARRNLDRLFGPAEIARDPFPLPRPQGWLAVQSLHYTAPQSQHPVLKSITFALEPGQVCAVVGPSGAGKSTLCRLIVGAWKPAYGHIRLDGAEVSTWHSEDLGQYIGYLPQQVVLFPGSVAQNIARLRSADSADVIAAARLAGVHEMILRLPDGYETDIGVHGDRISTGQRQRLGLARALFGDPSLIVLDEPNANLDSEGDQALLQTLLALKQKGRTIVIVTHQQRMLQVCDMTLVLMEGQVTGFGKRDDALAALASSTRKPRDGAARTADDPLAARPKLVKAE